MDIDLSQSEKVFIVDGIHQGHRNDGRGLLDFRPTIVEFGVLPNAHGSARVQLGATDLVAAIKLKMRQVKDTKEFSNRVDFYVTCSAVASPNFAGKQGDECAERVGALLRKAYRNDLVIPELAQLKLSKDRYYQTRIDILILKYDGNAIDAASIAAKAALSDMKFVIPTMVARDGGKTIPQLPAKIQSQIRTLDVSTAPVIVTLNSVGDCFFVDATIHEEQCVGGVVHVGIIPPRDSDADNGECYLALLKNTCPHLFHEEKFDKLLSDGIEAAKELNRALMKRISEYKQESERNVEIRVNTFMR